MRPLLSEVAFARYRRFRAEHPDIAYTEPFVPCVDELTFGSGRPRFVYCGAAVAEAQSEGYGGSDREAWLASQNDTKRIVMERAAEGRSLTPFWKLWNAASMVVHGATISQDERMRSTVWTNLSKLGVVRESAPPDDAALRELDVAQLQQELSELRPDVLLCVSGELLTGTGNALFETLPRLTMKARTRNTHLKRLSTGGVLVWTNHPAHLRGTDATSNWYESLLSDLATALK